ncbi:MAG: hypothetical protein Q7J32_16705 [Sphingomonadaceae bacterium]|nr:hypothetical protein [Sphingomonadaceae bacterium]
MFVVGRARIKDLTLFAALPMIAHRSDGHPFRFRATSCSIPPGAGSAGGEELAQT